MATPEREPGLTDTDILIDASRGVRDAVALVGFWRARGDLRISIVSAMELIGGCANKAELTDVQEFLRHVAVVPVSANSSRTARRLMESFFLGHNLQIPHALIAATALALALPLYTKNVKHFGMIPSLSVIRPY